LQREPGRFPNYADWLRARSPELADEWRHRERQTAGIEGSTFVPPLPQDLRAFKAVVDGARVLYVHVNQSKTPAFADRGKNIDIFAGGDRAAVLAALQLSAQKWGSFVVHGGDRFKKLCAELAAEHGLKIVNPELQEAIAAARSRRQLDVAGVGPKTARPAVPRPEPVRSPLEAYLRHYNHAAGGAGPGGASQRDAMVAVHMRLTGHTRDQIAKAIREGAARLRPAEVRNWDEYGRRAADFAWSVPGVREGQQLAQQRQHILALEGRQNRDLEDGPPRGRGGLER
ncbi:MAG: LPD7 domain-containing protein, partial [Myxococcales bacterium]